MRLFRGVDRLRDGKAHGLDELWSWVSVTTWLISDIYCCCVLVVARGQSLEECWLSPAQKLSDRSVLLDVRLVVL